MTKFESIIASFFAFLLFYFVQNCTTLLSKPVTVVNAGLLIPFTEISKLLNCLNKARDINIRIEILTFTGVTKYLVQIIKKYICNNFSPN
jgi:hypothetical protein